MADLSDAPASTAHLMDAFGEWFTQEGVGDIVDEWIRTNAARMPAWADAGGEQSHEWWPLFTEYQQRFEGLLSEFVQKAGCTTEEFLAEAAKAEGMNEIYVKLFLAHAEYELFIEAMSMEANRQAAEQAVGAGL